LVASFGAALVPTAPDPAVVADERAGASVSARAAEPDDVEVPLDGEDDPFLDDEELDSSLEDDLEPELDEDDPEEDDEEGDESLEPTLAADAGDEEEDVEETVTVVPPDAEFDDDEPVAVVDEDDDDEEIEGLRDGEFVCRGCFMAKRETQLADPENLLCRDCS
jgi:hypothetical protein